MSLGLERSGSVTLGSFAAQTPLIQFARPSRATGKGWTVLNTFVREDAANIARRWAPALVACAVLLASTPLRAQDASPPPAPPPPVTVGAGVQTSFVHDFPSGGSSSDDFVLNSIRLYVNGNVNNHIKLMFNTEYDGVDNHVNVLDAAARFEMSDQVNFWVGRFLPPSDRANLYGPYYSNEWGVYKDGVQDGYPFVATGRDNGAVYWGQFGILKASVGAFDGPSATGNKSVLGAARLQLDFWDPEAGYYLNGTYYGDKNLLALGAAGQVQSGNTAFSGDFLMERKLGGAALSVEAEFAKYDKLGGYNSQYGTDQGGYVLAAYLFPQVQGMTGRLQLLGKFAKASFSNGTAPTDPDYNQKTTEVDFNWVIKEFNARVMLFYLQKNFSAVEPNDKQIGIGFQLQI